MAEVSPINTNDLLTNIQNRYNKDLIFTNVGETLIIVNPYQILPGLYTEEKMNEIITFCNENSLDKYIRGSPHCFDLTMHTIFDLIHSGKNQALVISGESGAGKTECAKLCMKFIAFYFGKKEETNENNVSLEDKILACNPVLEAFGNAKTVRNDNSSRFGKYIKIFINIENKSIVGAFMETYLLEKSRVVTIAHGERNYHIFYQIVLGLNFLIKEKFNYENVIKKLNEMGLKMNKETEKYIKNNLTQEKIKDLLNINDLNEVKLADFTYLKNDIYAVDTINDVFNFYEVLDSMINTNFSYEEINLVLALTLGILFVGNIEFKENGEVCKITEKGEKIQKKVCDIFNIKMEVFHDAFLYNVRIIKGETIKSPLKINDCNSFRDTFAKELYNRLFTYLVKKMNKTLFDEKIKESIENDPDVEHIGLLDIFGFECFKENSFEQFCINYANEKLQNLYVEDIFKEIENMFIKEGLQDHFTKIEYRDNQAILDAMGKYPTGIFYQLDNECNVSQNDMNLLGKIINTLKNNPHIKSSLKNKEKFFISHTAKDVEYNIISFCTKNLDEFKLRMKDSILSIEDKNIIEMIGEEDEESKGKKEKYLGGKFRSDMDNLAKALRQCVRHYIRCLKPNELKKKNYFVPWFSLQQIKYMGVLDTIKIRQEGFPVIKSKYEFYMKYEDAVDFPGKLFYKDVKEDNIKINEWVKIITEKLLPGFNEDFILFGKNVVLMKQKFCDDLDNSRKKALEIKEIQVTKITTKFHSIKPKKMFFNFYDAIFTLQQNYKLFAYINKMNKIREITKILQKKSKINQIQNYSKNFMEKIHKIKNFVNVSYFQYKQNKNYIKLLQTKFVIKNYVSQFKQQKYLKYRKSVKNLIEKRILNYINKQFEPFVIKIQKFFRSFHTKLKMGELYENIKKRRLILKEEIQCKRIQKFFRRHYYMNSILIKQKAVDKFIGLFKIKKFRNWFLNVRNKIRIIQGAYKKRYLMRHIISTRLKEFTEEEDNKYEEANENILNTFFPERINENNENNNENNENYSNYYLNHSPYDEPKLNFFAHVLDLDQIINLDDLYKGENSWAETFQEIIKHNVEVNTPIQLIEISEFHTSLVNSSGKTFCWGWNGNGQCGFNLNNDKDYLYENCNEENFDVNENDKFKNYVNFNDFNNVKNKEIEDDDFLNENFDFDAEINNIKEEKEMFENEEDFNEEKFDYREKYYIENPMIIENFNIKKIECGDEFTIILTKENKCFVFGSNNNYQLGISNQRNIYSPLNLTNLIKSQPENNINLKHEIIDIKISGKNAILLNENGEIIFLSCLYENEIYKFPFQINFPEIKFSNIECGKDFVLLLTNNGYLYSFGNNKFGQLGLGDFEDRNFPTLVKFFVENRIKVQQISCGYKHCCIKGNNKAYSFGCNSNGQLGTGNFKNMEVPFFNDIKFSKLKNNILQVSCGFRSTVFLTETRQIFWCGTNGDIKQQNKIKEFFYVLKIPDLFKNEFHEIIKLNHSFCRTSSILYATVAEVGPLKKKLNNPNKLNTMLNNLTLKWNDKDIFPPKLREIENYISEKHINKVSKNSNLNVSNKKK